MAIGLLFYFSMWIAVCILKNLIILEKKKKKSLLESFITYSETVCWIKYNEVTVNINWKISNFCLPEENLMFIKKS